MKLLFLLLLYSTRFIAYNAQVEYLRLLFLAFCEVDTNTNQLLALILVPVYILVSTLTYARHEYYQVLVRGLPQASKC